MQGSEKKEKHPMPTFPMAHVSAANHTKATGQYALH